MEDTHEALTVILNNSECFAQVVDTVFGVMDTDSNGLLNYTELQGFIETVCGNLGACQAPLPSLSPSHVRPPPPLNTSHKHPRLACPPAGVQNVPSPDQVKHVFKHLDLNSDSNVSKDELDVFLKHLFKEQLKHLDARLKKLEVK